MTCNLFVMGNASPCVNRLMTTVQVQPFFEEFTGFMSGRMLTAMTLSAALISKDYYEREKYRRINMNKRVCKPTEPESLWFKRRKLGRLFKKRNDYI